MKISLDWLRDFVDMPDEVDATTIAERLTISTVEVEGVHDVDGDSVLEIDNKSLTNRPDLWGHYGMAREVAAVFGIALRPLVLAPPPPAEDGLVGALDRELCQRFSLLRVDVDNSLPTPEIVRRRLRAVGHQPSDLVSDLSDYVMFTTGQPVQAWDARAVALPVAVASGADGELPLQEGAPHLVPAGVPVVRDAKRVLGIAGVVGSPDAAVGETSRSVLLAVATYERRAVRVSSQRVKLRSEASVRYEKGLDTQRVDEAVGYFLALLQQAAPAAKATAYADVVVAETAPAQIDVARSFLDSRMGVRLADEEIAATLGALGFDARVNDDSVSATAPSWRSTGDVSIRDDVLEELARVHGYDRLPTADLEVVLRRTSPVTAEPLDRRLRQDLAWRGGLHEVVTYPWVSDRALEAIGFEKSATVTFLGAPGDGVDSLRPLLLPNLVAALADNRTFGPDVGLFEVGAVYRRPNATSADPAPAPLVAKHLAAALTAPGDGRELFRRVKGLLENMSQHCHLAGFALEGPSDAPWADRSTTLAIRSAGRQVGTLTLLPPRLLRRFDIPDAPVAFAELDVGQLAEHGRGAQDYMAPPDLPGAQFDLSVVVAETTPWSEIEGAVRQLDQPLIDDVAFIDEYRSAEIGAGRRSLTVRISLQPQVATLSNDEISAVRAAAIAGLEARGAQLRL